ncbi:MAG: hypothetical protein ABSE46_05110 [Terracidiphilus sp.]|jgi:dienelactone hydrolase
MIFIIMLPAVLWLFNPQWPAWMGLFAVSAAILVPVHAWLEGMHWQMVPAYGAVGLLLLQESGIYPGEAARPYYAIGTCLLLTGTLLFSWAVPMFKLPKPTGKYPIGTRTLNLIDSGREEMHGWAKPGKREVIAQLWYPAAKKSGPKAKYRMRCETGRRSAYQSVLATRALQDAPLAIGRFPVIIHNPAWHGLRHSATFTIQELASHGFVVVSISHPYNSAMVSLSDGTVVNPNHDHDIGYSKNHYIPMEERIAIAEAELAVQTRDCRFVLDELQRFDRTVGHPLEARLQMDRVGAYGISFGGAVSMELAREDARVLSALELDGVLHGSVALQGLDKPFMIIDCPLKGPPFEVEEGADIRAVETAGLWKRMADTKALILSRCGGFKVLVEGIGKSDFYDQIFMSPLRKFSRVGSVPQKQVALILNSYVLAFYRHTLCDQEEQILAEGAQPFPEVRFDTWQRTTIANSLN